jgi:ribosomal protein L37AE/L43A
MIDDFDQPNTAPGTCPDCGQPANIWVAISQQWECSFCNWQGRNPTRPQEIDL